jgi:AraC-like DNA-binding protein
LARSDWRNTTVASTFSFVNTADNIALPATLLERLARVGVDVDTVLRRAELPRSRFGGTRPGGTTAEYFALWKAVGECGSGPDVGLRMGSHTLPHHQSVATLAALHSPTLGEGLKKFARYKRLVCPEEITIDTRRGEARLRFEWLLADTDPPPMLIDCIFASIVDIAKRGTAEPIRPRRIELTRPRAHEEMLRGHFGCDVRFDRPFDVLVFDETALGLPLVTHNPQLLAVIVPGLESALAETGRSRTLADDVRIAISETISGERPAVEKVAKSLGMSPRTLQRRLGELGTTYQKLLDQVRHRSARRLLSKTDLGPAEVAFLLGFEEQNSFTRAFHGWEGTTPVRWRATAR